MGPQITLYVPRSLLKIGINEILVLEFEKTPCSNTSSCNVELVATPNIDGKTPSYYRRL